MIKMLFENKEKAPKHRHTKSDKSKCATFLHLPMRSPQLVTVEKKKKKREKEYA